MNIAAENGYPEANQGIELIIKDITNEQILRGRILSSVYLEKQKTIVDGAECNILNEQRTQKDQP